MGQVALSASGLERSFNRRIVFSGLEFDLRSTDTLAITGRNGSGKTTLLKILAGVLSPSKGRSDLSIDGSDVTAGMRYRYVGFVAPYLQLYEEFSAIENLRFIQRVRRLPPIEEVLVDRLVRLGLEDRLHDPIRTYSSGMKQRVKYAFALLHDPPVLLLDEPTSNLDAAGIESVLRIVEERKKEGIVVIATNREDEAALCGRVLDLDAPGRACS